MSFFHIQGEQHRPRPGGSRAYRAEQRAVKVAVLLMAILVSLAVYSAASRFMTPPAAAPVAITLLCVPLTADRERAPALAVYHHNPSGPALVCSGQLQ